jgi:hypothetical protein
MTRPPSNLSTAMIDAAVDLMGRAGEVGVVEVQGLSMEPTFGGTRKIAVEFGAETLRFGEILVFRQRGILVVHRLIGRGARFRMRGDGTISFDPWLAPEDVVGRVIAMERESGEWLGVRSRLAKLYGVAVGLHNLFWGGLGAVLVKLMGRRGEDWRWRVGKLDQWMLRLAHRLFFSSIHKSVPNPSTKAGAVGILNDPGSDTAPTSRDKNAK